MRLGLGLGGKVARVDGGAGLAFVGYGAVARAGLVGGLER